MVPEIAGFISVVIIVTALLYFSWLTRFWFLCFLVVVLGALGMIRTAPDAFKALLEAHVFYPELWLTGAFIVGLIMGLVNGNSLFYLRPRRIFT